MHATISSLISAVSERWDQRVHVNPNTKAAFIIGNDGRAQMLANYQERSPRHRFSSLGDFCAWLLKWSESPDAEILFDGNVMRATVERGATSGEVRYQTQRHPARKRWEAILGRGLDQKTLSRFVAASLQDFPEVFDSDGRAAGRGGDRLSSELQVLRVSRSTGFTGELDPRGFYRVQSSDSKVETTARIPSETVLELPWFLGSPQRYAVTVSIEMDVDDKGKPSFVLNFVGPELVEHLACEDLIHDARELLGPNFLIGMGSLDYVLVDE